jgi:WD40 repeat protein
MKKHILPFFLLLVPSLFCTQCSTPPPVQPGTPIPVSEKPITFWNATQVKELADWPDVDQDSVLSLAFSPNGQTLASGTYHGKVRLWRVSDGILLWTYALELDPDAILVYPREDLYSAGLTTVAFSPDGKIVAAISIQDGGVRLLNASDGTLIKMLRFHPLHPVNGLNLAFSPDGQFLAAAYKGDMLLWRLSDGTTLQLEKTGYGGVNAGNGLAFSLDGTLLARGYDYGAVTVWRVRDGAVLFNLDPKDGLPIEDVNYIGFLKGGMTFITGSFRYAVRLWRTKDGAITATWKGDDYFVESMVLSPASGMLAIGTETGDIKLWDGATHVYRATLKGKKQLVLALTFSSAGDLLASGGEDGIIRLWGVRP